MAAYTPMMEQYFKIKNEYTHCLVFFRLGDFYELFFDDAYIASRELDITLTGRDCGQEDRAPMCGVPYHAAEGYIAKLIEKGYKVAICEQTEDPKQTKTIVKREVIRVVTPGTVNDPNMLDSGKNNYIASIYEDKSGRGIAVCDVTTGEFFVTSLDLDKTWRLTDEIATYNPAEIICSAGFTDATIVEAAFKIKISKQEVWAFDFMNCYKRLISHFNIANLNGFGIENDKHGVCAAGGLLQYLQDTQKNALTHISTIKPYKREGFMILDASSRRNLELTETMRDKSKKHTLLSVLDKTKTSMGARLLRKWLEQPLKNVSEIEMRLNAVEEYKLSFIEREELKEVLGAIYDLERLMGRVVYQSANCRDFISLKNSFKMLPFIKRLLNDFETGLNRYFCGEIDCLEDLCAVIETAVVEEPPFSIREGGFIRDGFNLELDKFREAKNKGANWLLDLENREKELTGIKNLKVRFNKIFGYYIEITNSYLNLAPDRYIRRQTLSNGERFTTPELKKIEEQILGADSKIVELEYDIFINLRGEIASEIKRVQASASIVAAIDALVSLAEAADKNGYVKPFVNDGGVIDIRGGRHPVVEKMSAEAFVPNDTYLDSDNSRLSIITGPNMAGKSTFMRQTALITLMAQVGSFVPAESAVIGVCDRIFTRVGASDDLATGQSTFMVEMSEVANILNNSTKNSLIILDEIGRGTSTFDGLSIAWAVLEHIANKDKIGAKTLFATHYHELTELEGKVEGVVNYCVTVKEKGEEVIFLRKIIRGGADNSYGIQVARLAGLPGSVLERSKQILTALNNADIAKKAKTEDNSDEVVYYGKRKKDQFSDTKIIINELENLDIDSMTPKEAQAKLYHLREEIKKLYAK